MFYNENIYEQVFVKKLWNATTVKKYCKLL
jgi:hypothetical protein